jgi:hypothetical protein
MNGPVIYETHDSATLTGVAPVPGKVEKHLPPPARPVKRPGPIIAGGIIRFDLGANEER